MCVHACDTVFITFHSVLPFEFDIKPFQSWYGRQVPDGRPHVLGTGCGYVRFRVPHSDSPLWSGTRGGSQLETETETIRERLQVTKHECRLRTDHVKIPCSALGQLTRFGVALAASPSLKLQLKQYEKDFR